MERKPKHEGDIYIDTPVRTRIIGIAAILALIGVSVTLVLNGTLIPRAIGAITLCLFALPLAAALVVRSFDQRPLYVVKSTGLWRRRRRGGTEIPWSAIASIRIVVSAGHAIVQLMPAPGCQQTIIPRTSIERLARRLSPQAERDAILSIPEMALPMSAEEFARALMARANVPLLDEGH